MRTVISLLVTTFFFGSLALERQNNLHSEFAEQALMASKSLSRGRRPKEPQQPAPHRGSGRRDLIEYFVNPSAAV